MDFPKFPTDNLYKFQATICLTLAIVLYISALYLLTFYEGDRPYQIIDIRLTNELSQLEAELETNKKELANFKSRFWAETNSKPYMLTAIDSSYFERGVTSTSKIIDSLVKCQKIILKKESELNSEIEINSYKIDYTSYFVDLFDIFALLALAIILMIGSIKGFHGWKNHLQKYQDILVKKNAEGFIKDPYSPQEEGKD